ncbi:arrestin domain-containing protein, putative [Bodo saltans]|uniref:Arrestin domain-containing protein, putative n=1 Tax=Bodo saltans TaxID=75058 RepID=A0A0S4IQD6_BODSA|nr:arrestin domain-containing protein, putative [Bodo saltans]|eukprot:CUF95115.1 arrestin domain-containing protein, putative [Bodo saltans]
MPRSRSGSRSSHNASPPRRRSSSRRQSSGTPVVAGSVDQHGGLQRFQVLLDPPAQLPDGTVAWHPNSKVTGCVVFHAKSSTRVICMRVKFVGREYVASPNHASSSDGRASQGKVILFKDIQVLYGTGPTSAEKRMKRGNGAASASTDNELQDATERAERAAVMVSVGPHKIPFEFQFPERVASSCRVLDTTAPSGAPPRYAHITYQVKAYADLTGVRARNVMSVTLLPVIAPMSALQERFLQNDRLWGVSPLTSLQHYFYCCRLRCCHHGEVKLQATCQPHVAVADRNTTLHVAINVVNNSTVPVHSVEVSLRNRVVVRQDANTTSSRLVETVVLQSNLVMDVASTTMGQASTMISLPSSVLRASTPQSMVSHLIRSKWFVVVRLGGDDSDEDCACCWMPLVVVPSIDDANGAASIDLVEPL